MKILKRSEARQLQCSGMGSRYYRHYKKAGLDKGPCFSLLEVEERDLVRLYISNEHVRVDLNYGFTTFVVGFICCECGCFTVIPMNSAMRKIVEAYPRIAPAELSIYRTLTKEEQAMSTKFFAG